MELLPHDVLKEIAQLVLAVHAIRSTSKNLREKIDFGSDRPWKTIEYASAREAIWSLPVGAKLDARLLRRRLGDVQNAYGKERFCCKTEWALITATKKTMGIFEKMPRACTSRDGSVCLFSDVYGVDRSTVVEAVGRCRAAGLKVHAFTKKYPGLAFSDGVEHRLPILSAGYTRFYRGTIIGLTIKEGDVSRPQKRRRRI